MVYLIHRYKGATILKKDIYVTGAVIVKDGKIFCAQRNENGSLPLLWEFPGGKIEDQETKEESLIREIKEELDCTIEVLEEIKHTIYEYSFGIVHLTTFHCKLLEGQPKLLEHQDSKWLKPDELHTLEWAPADIPTIEKVINNARRYL